MQASVLINDTQELHNENSKVIESIIDRLDWKVKKDVVDNLRVENKQLLVIIDYWAKKLKL